MTITLHIQATGESGAEITNELRILLNGMTAYRGEPISYTEDLTNRIASATAAVTESRAQADAPKMTAAQRKAAEKAAKEAAQQAISTGEERVDPEADKQDVADEAAETKAEPFKFTHDSVRALLGGYVQAYGMAAAQEDGAKMIEIAKISDLKDDQAVFAKAVLAIAQGIEKNPYKREIAGDGITAEKLAELKPIVTAAMAVK